MTQAATRECRRSTDGRHVWIVVAGYGGEQCCKCGVRQISDVAETLTADFEGMPSRRVKMCSCGECGNRFYLPYFQNGEWKPKFCPFCGTEFVRETVTDLSLQP